MSYYYGFDTTADEDTQIRLQKELSARMEQEGLTGYADGVAAGKNSFYIMDGDFSSWGSSWDCCL